ncbi:MAG: tetratricopeptide repeat protein, partial [Lentisphaeraceae bacterium]|nr:tetratricopeptide repeat protein [Lentisphaeraceae bacterium]
MRLILIAFFTIFLSLSAQDDIFDLEKGAPKKEKKKIEVNHKFLSDLLISGDYLKLEETFNELSSDSPDKLKEVPIRKLLIKFQIETGKYKKALEEIEKSEFTADEEAYFLSSEIFRLTGNYQKAKDAAVAGREKYPDGFMMSYQHWHLGQLTGNAAEENEGWSKVKSLYKKTKYGREGEADQLAFIGRAAVQRSPQTAYNLFQRAYKRNDKYVDVYVWAGQHCADKYAWNFAIEEYTKALQINSNHALANTGMAYVLMEKGDYQKAKELVDAALLTNPNESYAIQLKSELLLADDKSYEALRLLKKGLETNPKDLELLSQVAAVYEQLSDTENRDKYIEKVLKINPKFSSVFIYISQSCENRRQFPASVEWAKKAIELNSRDWEGYYVAGMNLLRLGEETEGYKILDRAFKLNGFNVWARNVLVLLDRDFKKKEYKQFETEHF